MAGREIEDTIAPLGEREVNMFGLPVVSPDELDLLLDAVRTLAQMTREAPSYEAAVVPFSVAHQHACEVLEKLQTLGVREAR